MNWIAFCFCPCSTLSYLNDRTNVLMQFAQAACFPCHAHFLLYEVFEAHFWQSVESVDKYCLQMSEVEQTSKNSLTSLSSFATRSWNARRERFAELHSTPTCPQWWRFLLWSLLTESVVSGRIGKACPILKQSQTSKPLWTEWHPSDTQTTAQHSPTTIQRIFSKSAIPTFLPSIKALWFSCCHCSLGCPRPFWTSVVPWVKMAEPGCNPVVPWTRINHTQPNQTPARWAQVTRKQLERQ